MLIYDISPHRVYLVSLQHYLYILSVALVPNFILADRTDGVTAMLLCGVRTFLLIAQNGDKAVCAANLRQYINEVKFS
jgi:hypothetical protein